jgi:hypothetical protein
MPPAEPVPKRYRQLPPQSRPPSMPPPCRQHGDTTRRCALCNTVLCWRCDNDAAPSLCISDVCSACFARRDQAITSSAIFDADKFKAATAHGARFGQIAKGTRPTTSAKKAGVLSRVTSFCIRDCGFEPFVHEGLPETILLWFIELRMLGTNAILGPAVLASTIEKDVAAMHSWALEYASRHKTPVFDSTLCQSNKPFYMLKTTVSCASHIASPRLSQM